jgi:hypothetical protein
MRGIGRLGGLTAAATAMGWSVGIVSAQLDGCDLVSHVPRHERATLDITVDDRHFEFFKIILIGLHVKTSFAFLQLFIALQ